MTYLDPIPPLRQLETALEASCSACVALESLGARRTDLTGDLIGVRRQIAQIIDALRCAISELRPSPTDTETMLEFGFVMAAESAADTDRTR